ncbi:hypothetical protein U27_03412 [Candidatus Vecturithrix granuli]|uniref:Porin n=1 Tax=Vecturithrix granuli TaxID=1499967 RepID=A0A081BVU5_VECG1|nr:hypothetical protein U27_03412 [Candidatus Vecturithrix granuli]
MKKFIRSFIIILPIVMVKSLFAFDGEMTLGGKNIDVHGFISQGYLHSDGNNVFADTEDGTFQFNEAGLNFSTDVTDRLRIGLQLFSRDLGDLSNNEIQLDWAYGDYRWRDWVGFRAGKIKIPYGFYNETRDIDLLRTSVFLPASIYYEGERDIVNALQGVGVYGDLALKWVGSLSYQFQWGQQKVFEDGSTAKYEADQEQTTVAAIEEIDLGDIYTFSVEWETPIPGLRFKEFFMTSDRSLEIRIVEENSEDEEYDSALSSRRTEDIETVILSGEYNWNAITVATEYATSQKGKEGYYASLSYRVNDWIECGLYYSVYYPYKDDKDGSELEAQGRSAHQAWQKEWVLTSRFDINDHWIWKIEGHFINGTGQILSDDNPEGLDENSYLLAVKTTYHF